MILSHFCGLNCTSAAGELIQSPVLFFVSIRVVVQVEVAICWNQIFLHFLFPLVQRFEGCMPVADPDEERLFDLLRHLPRPDEEPILV